MNDQTDKTEGSDRGEESESNQAIKSVIFRDEGGNRYTVIAYRPYPFLGITDYALETAQR